MKLQAEKESANKQISMQQQCDYIVQRLQNVDPKSLRSKLKDFLEDSQIHKALIEEQKKFTTLKSDFNKTKHKTSIRQIKRIDYKQLQKPDPQISKHTSSKDSEKKRSRTIDVNLDQQQSKNQSKQDGEYQKKNMVDLKLNYMVSDLKERLGFVTKKQKMDHMMQLLAQKIKDTSSKDLHSPEKVQPTKNHHMNKFKSGEYVLQNDGDEHQQSTTSANQLEVQESKNYFESKRPSQQSQKKEHSTQLNFYHNSKANNAYLSNQSGIQNSSNQKTHTPFFMKADSKFQSDKKTSKFSRILDHSQETSQIYYQSKDLLQQILYNNDHDKKSDDQITISMKQQLEKDAGIVKDFLNSLYADPQWSKIASDQQFDQIMNLLSEYFGMDDTYENKYNNLPRYKLAQQERKRQLSNEDSNHIGSERKHNKPSLLKESPKDEFIDHDQAQQKFENLLKQCDLDSTLMKEKFVLQRYAKYLNKCMFIAQDDFIKKKFKAYQDKIAPKTGENFFQRMQKDQEKRKEKDKITKENLHGTRQLQMSGVDKLSNTIDSSAADTHKHGLFKKLGSKMQVDISKFIKRQQKFTLEREKSHEDSLHHLNDEIIEELSLEQSRRKSNSSYVTNYKSTFARKMLNPIDSEESLRDIPSLKKLNLLYLKQIKNREDGNKIIDKKIQNLQSKMYQSQRFDKGKLTTPQTARPHHPIRSSNGSFSSTSQIMRNIKDEENLRQCEQLIHELQEEIPPAYQQSSSKGNLSQRSNTNTNTIRQSTSLSNLRRSVDQGIGRNNAQNPNQASQNFKDFKRLISKNGKQQYLGVHTARESFDNSSNQRKSFNSCSNQQQQQQIQPKKGVLSTSINLIPLKQQQNISLTTYCSNQATEKQIGIDGNSSQHVFEDQSTMRNDDQHSIEQSPSQRSKSISQPRKSVIGQTSTMVLMLDKQLSQSQKENRELKDKLDVAYKMQHQLENELEEFQVEAKRKEEEFKQMKRKFQEFQKNHINCDKEKKELNDKLMKLDKEKFKVSDKYIRLSQRLKEGNGEPKGKEKEYQTMYQKAIEEIHQLRVKLQGYEEMQKQGNQVVESQEAQQIFQRFQSELVCACLHELMVDLSTRMQIQGDETFDILKFQQFLREQNCKECGHADLIDLELGSIIVLSCKRIKDLTYLNDELGEKVDLMNTEYQQIQQSFNEKSMQLEQMQQNLLQMVGYNNPMNSFFNGQNTLTSSQIFRQINTVNHMTDESPSTKQRGYSKNVLQSSNSSNVFPSTMASQTLHHPSFIIGMGNMNGKENWNNENQMTNTTRNQAFRNSKTSKNIGGLAISCRDQSPIDFGSQSAIRGDASPDQLLISRDTSLINFNSNFSNIIKAERPMHQTLIGSQYNQRKQL